MKTCYLVKPGRLEIRETPVPEPGDDELLIQVKAALTCGTDLKAFRRGHPKMPMPTPFGHEFAGTIAKLGKNLNGFHEGDEVMLVHTAPCGDCTYCARGLENLCRDTMKNMVLGGYAEFIKIPRQIVKYNMYHKPKDLTFEEAAILEPLACVVHALDPLAIHPEDSVLIIGAGAIGLLHILMAKIKGAQKIIVIGKHDHRLTLAKKLGADVAIDINKEAPQDLVRDLTRGIGANWVFECTGRPEVWEQSVPLAAKGGTIILFGGCPSGSTVTFETGRLHYDEITLKGAFHFTPKDVLNAYHILAEKQIAVQKLITRFYALKDINRAFDTLMSGDGVKFAIIP